MAFVDEVRIVGLEVSQKMSFATHSLKKFYGQVQNTEHHIPYSRLDFFFWNFDKKWEIRRTPSKRSALLFLS